MVGGTGVSTVQAQINESGAHVFATKHDYVEPPPPAVHAPPRAAALQLSEKSAAKENTHTIAIPYYPSRRLSSKVMPLGSGQ